MDNYQEELKRQFNALINAIESENQKEAMQIGLGLLIQFLDDVHQTKEMLYELLRAKQEETLNQRN